ncbi:hypothetical protein I7I48_00664 [Histoplasma ohiense]|nr:hypothetical protein I7I48_00664 [Histoplasma ohiense (nom. inval.)]
MHNLHCMIKERIYKGHPRNCICELARSLLLWRLQFLIILTLILIRFHTPTTFQLILSMRRITMFCTQILLSCSYTFIANYIEIYQCSQDTDPS